MVASLQRRELRRRPPIERVAWREVAPRPTSQPDRVWLAALGTAVATAEAAVLVLARDGLIAARPVDALEHFEAADIERARRYGRGQLALAAMGGLAEGVLLVWLVRRARVEDRAAGAGGRGARRCVRNGRPGGPGGRPGGL